MNVKRLGSFLIAAWSLVAVTFTHARRLIRTARFE